MSQKYTVLFENIFTNVSIIYLEIWIWQMVLKFTTDPQYSFTIINHFGNTSSPIIRKKQPFLYCTTAMVPIYYVKMSIWSHDIWGNMGIFAQILLHLFVPITSSTINFLGLHQEDLTNQWLCEAVSAQLSSAWR